MSTISDEAHRTELLNRLKRAEGQLRGIQRMIIEGKSCLETLDQIAAVRKALDSARTRMVVCYLSQELHDRLELKARDESRIDSLIEDMQALFSKST